MKTSYISGVLLASGFGKRAGGNKLLFSWNGKTILFHAIKNALLSDIDELIIVVQEKHTIICRDYVACLTQNAEKPIHIIANNQASEGMAASVRLGVSHCSDASSAVLFLLADQVFFITKYINALCAQYKLGNSTIVAPFYNEQRQNPVLFTLALYKEDFLMLHGDIGARDIIKKHSDQVGKYNISDPIICADMDTVEQYVAYKSQIFSWKNFLQQYKIVSVMGAGGKTQLIWNIADELWNAGQECLVTTTTKMWNDVPEDVSLILLENTINTVHDLRKRQCKKVLIGSTFCNEGKKILGLSYDAISTIHQKEADATILIEADGAREKIFKIHAEHEPCIHPQSDLVIIVIHIGIIGKGLQIYAHRPHYISNLSSNILPDEKKKERVLQQGCTADELAEMLQSKNGYIDKSYPLEDRKNGDAQHKLLFFNGIESQKDYKNMVHVIKKIHPSLESLYLRGFVKYVYGSNIHKEYHLVDDINSLI